MMLVKFDKAKRGFWNGNINKLQFKIPYFSSHQIQNQYSLVNIKHYGTMFFHDPYLYLFTSKISRSLVVPHARARHIFFPPSNWKRREITNAAAFLILIKEL